MSQILAGDEIAESVNFLNSNKREALNVVLTWANNHVKVNAYNVELVYKNLLGRRNREKSHMAEEIYNDRVVATEERAMGAMPLLPLPFLNQARSNSFSFKHKGYYFLWVFRNYTDQKFNDFYGVCYNF